MNHAYSIVRIVDPVNCTVAYSQDWNCDSFNFRSVGQHLQIELDTKLLYDGLPLMQIKNIRVDTKLT